MNKLPFERIEREIIVRQESETDLRYGCVPEQRSVEKLIEFGIVNIDKPDGPTSHEVSAFVKRILHIDRAGHSGTLDPGVTGVLPTALDKATRVVQTLLKTGKEYIGVMHVHKDVPEEELRKTINEFIGKINQLPPVKSAVKRQLRQREVYYLEIIEIKGKDVLFRTGVEAGTYIRKLCSDIGEKIGGAHMAELRRTKVGPFDETTIITLQDLTDAYWFWKNEGKEGYIRYCVRPIEFALGHIAKLWVFDNTVDAICNGIDLKIPGISKLSSGINKDDMVAVMSLKGELIGLGDAKMASEQIMKEKKGIAVKVHKVFMNPGTYPRIKKEE